MWGIVLYYLWIFVVLYLWFVLFFCAYYTNDTKKHRMGDKVKFPLWLLTVTFLCAFIPGINLIEVICLCIYMYCIHDEDDVEFRNILFKNI